MHRLPGKRVAEKFGRKEEEVARLDAALAVLWAARSPEERAKEEDILRHERESMNYLKDLLVRAGIKVEGDLSWPELMAAWNEVGLPPKYFARGTHRFLAEKLEARLKDLAWLARFGEPKPEDVALPKRLAGAQSVGKKGTRKYYARPVNVDRELLCSIRTDRQKKAPPAAKIVYRVCALAWLETDDPPEHREKRQDDFGHGHKNRQAPGN
jgi:hypothetical protein